MNKLLKVVLPIFVIGIGAAIGLAMIWSRAEPEKRRVEPLVPLVRVHHVVLQDVRLKVNSQGTVSPRTESVLVPEVSGRIIEVSPSFAPSSTIGSPFTMVAAKPRGLAEKRPSPPGMSCTMRLVPGPTVVGSKIMMSAA